MGLGMNWRLQCEQRKNLNQIPKEREEEIYEMIFDLNRLGYSFEEVCSGATVNNQFLAKIYQDLNLPVVPQFESCTVENQGQASRTLQASKSRETDSSAHDTIPEDIYVTTNKVGEHYHVSNDKPVQTVEAGNIGNCNSDATSSLPQQEKSTVNTLMEETSKIIMQLRLQILKLKNATKGSLPNLNERDRFTLLKKKNLIFEEINAFYASIGVQNEASFVEAKSTSLNTGMDILPEQDRISTCNQSSADISKAAPVEIQVTEPSKLDFKRSTPDSFTPYQSLNIIKRTKIQD